MTLSLRYMTLADVPQVAAIDRLAFDLPWSERAYSYEVTESTYSYMVVLEVAEEAAPGQGWLRWLPALNGRGHSRQIVGYGGLWNIMSEAHVSTIAVHPNYQGRGWGEILLAGMVRRSLRLQADYVALEVRVTNTRAQNLYRKYEFETVGTKAHYYRNNNEDAYDMRLALTTPDIQPRLEERFAALQAKHGFTNHYTEHEPPHRQPGNLSD
ncbi:MAG TPA: ribosomal protein S18-alanine N-acetyltransferase [Phototrophicaceae bacterium]|nr:ribosomal protein S18-alanine N-acetyltransferase [Phototrophicaceae bacterium]